MPSVNDLQLAWLRNQLGLPATNAQSVNDLELLFYTNQNYGLAGNRRYAFNKYYAVDTPGGNSTVNPVLNDLSVFPFTVGKVQSFDRLACAVSTAATAASGSVVRLGLYDTASNGDPQNLLAQVGPFSTESTGVKEGAIAVQLVPGIYWLGACVQVSVAALVMRGIGAAWSPYVSYDLADNNASGCGYLTAGVTGALPSPFPTSHANAGIFSGSVYRVMMRAA